MEEKLVVGSENGGADGAGAFEGLNEGDAEDLRQELQRSARRRPESDRRELGAVYTPPAVAAGIVTRLLPLAHGARTMLEPSVGDGAFIDALADAGVPLDGLTAIDIDGSVVTPLAHRYPTAKFLHRNFLEWSSENPEARFDLIIGNPPFVRARSLPTGSAALLDALSVRTDYPRARLKNAWSAFVVAAEALLSVTGVLAFVLPYELLHVDYGTMLIDHLIPRFARLEIVISETRAFPGIDQDAVVLIASRSSDETGVFVRKVASMEDLATVPGDVRRVQGAWRGRLLPKPFLVDEAAVGIASSLADGAHRFEDLCSNVAGIVTAANDYFIVDDATIELHRLHDFARPIVKRGGYLGPGPVFTTIDYENLLHEHPRHLLDFSGIDRKRASAGVRAYLEEGERRGAHLTYKALGRRTWFELRVPDPADGFFFKRSHSYPRICVNEAGVHATDAAYLLRPLLGATMKGICYSFYNSLTLLFAELNGRFYGGGVLEITPNELRRLPILYTEPSDAEFAAFASAEYWNDPVALAEAGDERLTRIHGVPADELAVLRTAWVGVRRHRLRHA